MTDRFVDGYLLYLLARASAQASRQFHAQLPGKGVSVSDWRILAVLSGADAGVSVGELAARCLFKQPTLTRAVDRLERRGLVRRDVGDGDRRRVVVSLTGQGAALVSGLIEEARAHEAALLSGYTPEEAGTLRRVLATLIERTG